MADERTDNARMVADQMAAEPLDVLVIGGGIVGSGVARDAAMRGLRTGLIEQYDFAWGTSSRSSRLLHGGLRYLAQGRVRLVREASVEKRIIHHIAPHVAEPLAFIFPSYRRSGWPLWQLRIGVKIYDLLCGGQNFGRSTALSRRALRDTLPGLTEERLSGAVRYFDGLTNDARLVIDTLRSAANHGALLENYCRFEGARRTHDGWVCDVHDTLADRPLTVETRCVVNAAGPWADRFEQSGVGLRLTKGVHLVIDRERLPVPDAVVMVDANRILFAIPWGERVILGTTDTDFDGHIEDVRCEDDDVHYILEIVNRSFPQAALVPGDVVGAWAGLRPLIAAAREGGARLPVTGETGTGVLPADKRGRPSDISRRHIIRQGEPGWWDVAGGKLTTYRLMGEQTVDRLLTYLHRKADPCRTAVEPLLPPVQVQGISGMLPPEVTRKVVEHYCRNEWAVHLADVMVRRTSWHHYRHDRSAVAEQVAGWMADLLGWDDERRAREMDSYKAL